MLRGRPPYPLTWSQIPTDADNSRHDPRNPNWNPPPVGNLMTERGRATRVVLAPDKFKGSLTAAEVAEALAAGMVDVLPQLETILLPVADGGDGTVAAAP